MTSPLNSMVKEYLNSRGFSKTAATFDEEIKNEIGLHDSVDKIVFQIFTYLEEYNIDKLLDTWKFLNEKVFNTLSENQSKSAAELETAVYKLYVINCVKNEKQDKVHEFFFKISEMARNNPVWTDWFALPYIKNPAKEKLFEKYFLSHWQACLIVWLYNFLSIAIQQMDKPRLVICVERSMKRDVPTEGVIQSSPANSSFESGLTDDFSVIAQCGTPSSKTSSKSLRSIFRNIAGK